MMFLWKIDSTDEAIWCSLAHVSYLDSLYDFLPENICTLACENKQQNRTTFRCRHDAQTYKRITVIEKRRADKTYIVLYPDRTKNV